MFLDLDGAPVEPVLKQAPPPHLLVETSPGKYHAYWTVSGVPLERFSEFQKGLAKKFGGDPAVCDLPRLMRLPGFDHQKGDPFRVKLLECREELPPYPLADLKGLLDFSSQEESTIPVAALRTVPEGGRHSALTSLAGHLRNMGFTPEEIGEMLTVIDAHRCNPPINDPNEIRDIARSSADWDPGREPEPLPNELQPVMKFPLSLLPSPLREFVMDIAERMHCPPDFPAVAVIVAMGSLVGRQCGILPKEKDNWTVVPNLWGLAVGRPAVLKSPALNQGLAPMEPLIKEASEDFTRNKEKYQASKEGYSAEAKGWKSRIQAASKNGEDVSELRVNPPGAPEEPIEIRYRTNAGSVERLIQLLNQNPNGLLLHRDEAVGWLASMDRQGHETDRAFYLEAWNGDGATFSYDTFAHGHLNCESLCLSVLGTIQPGPLASLVADAAISGGRDDGLLQRLQLAVYPDVGKWINVDQWPNEAAREAVETIFRRLAFLDVKDPHAHISGIPAFRFSPEGQAVFTEWRENLERLVEAEKNPVLESHFAKYRSLMPSLALLFFLLEPDGPRRRAGVSYEAAIRAAAWCDYMATHVRRIYGLKSKIVADGARHLLKKLLQGELDDGFTARDVRNRKWSWLTQPAEIKAALDLLVAKGWVIAKKAEPGDQGGRPTIRFSLSPRAWEFPDRTGTSDGDTPSPALETDWVRKANEIPWEPIPEDRSRREDC